MSCETKPIVKHRPNRGIRWKLNHLQVFASPRHFPRRQLTQTVVVMTTITQKTVAATIAMTTVDEDELRDNPSQHVKRNSALVL